MVTIWIIILLLGAVGWLLYLFNTLVGLSNHADAAWAEIDAQLKRRYELVGKLIELAKAHGIAGTDSLAAARATAADAYSPAEKSRTEPAVVAAIQPVLSAASSNTTLAGNEEFSQLRHTLENIEQYLQQAGPQYNRIAQELNDLTGSFPNSFAASLFGLESRQIFQTNGEKSDV